MPQLHLENISKSYGARRVLRGLNLKVTTGEVVGVVGSNGSGKSTLLRIIAGLLRPSSGSVTLNVDGRNYQESQDRRRVVGYLSPDIAFYPELTAVENLTFFARAGSIGRTASEINALIAMVGLATRRQEPVATFSSGMKQRLRLALALLSGTSILLLDEPTLALDTAGCQLVEEIIDRFRAKNGLVMLATNDPTEMGWADRLISVALTHEGRGIDTGSRGDDDVLGQ